MRRLLSAVLVVAAVSCGGKPKPSTTPPPQLPPDEKPQEPDTSAAAKPPETPPDKPAEPAEPPPGPVDVTVPAAQETVKLVTPGKGKRTKLAVTAKAGDKQAIEIVLDLFEHQSASKEAGGDQDNAFPTLVFDGNAEVKNVDDKGNIDYVITVTGTDVRDASGKVEADDLDKLKGVLAGLQGMTISGSVQPDGTPSDLKFHLDSAKPGTDKMVEQIAQMGLPLWPRLPAEPVGVGAKWAVTHDVKLFDKVNVTYTMTYAMPARTAKGATLKETVKVSGADQTLGDAAAGGAAKLTNIGGSGDGDATLVPGALFPALSEHVETKFDAEVTGPDASGKPKTEKLTTDLKQSRALTLK